jgi:hypothetical protein
MQPLTRLTVVSEGCVIVRFAALNNFDQIVVRGRQIQQIEQKLILEPTTPVTCEFEIFSISFCHDRQEVFAVVSFTQNGEYRIDFNFMKEAISIASVPYFFDVSGASEFSVISADAVLPKTRVWPPLPIHPLVTIHPSASKIVTMKQLEEVSVTVPIGRRLAVNLRDREGRLVRCSLKERIEKADTVIHRFQLSFPAFGQFSLAVSLDMNLVFNQRYRYIDVCVENDPSEETAIQNALAQRIETLTHGRLLSDIPENVKALVRSWL